MSISYELAAMLMTYCPETGALLWNRRPAFMFKTERASKVWNARFAGMEAGSIDSYGYREISVSPFAYKAHRLAWLLGTKQWPINDIDHIDGNRLNNRLSNLRDVERATNCENRKRARSDSRTGLIGASLHKASGLYYAVIRVRGRRISLGYYKTAEQASDAYLKAKIELHEGYAA